MNNESFASKVVRLPFAPVLTHMDSRLANLTQYMDRHCAQIGHWINVDLTSMLEKQHEEVGGWINFWGQHVNQKLVELHDHVHADAQAAVQSGMFAERALDEAAEKLALMNERLDRMESHLTEKAPVRDEEASLSKLLAHDGPIAEAGLWFNPPVVITHRNRTYQIAEVHERIVEVPFVYRHTAALAKGAKLLDIGCAESTVAFSLASMGYSVTAVDQRGYPLQHPNLFVVQESLQNWDGPSEKVDAVLCLSTLEHLGLKAYQSTSEDSKLDVKALALFRRWLKPGGLLILTAPFGHSEVSDFERTYSRDDLNHMLKDWTIRERIVYGRIGSTEWRQRDEAAPWPSDRRGVVLICADRS